MLVEFLDEVRAPLLRRLIERAAPEKGLRERLPELVNALVMSVRRGRVEPVRLDLEPEVALRAYALIRDAVFDLIQDRAAAAPLAELRIVSDWLAAGVSEAAERCATRIRRMSALLDAVPDHVGMVDRRGTVLYANRAALIGVGAATGVPSDEIVGRDGRDLGLPQDFVQQFEREREEALKGRIVTAEALFPTPGGGRWREDTHSPVYRNGEVEAVALVSRDIHARRQAQNRLQLLSKLSLLLEASNYEDVLDALARVSIPELADWCVVDVVEDEAIRRAKVAHRDPAQADLAAELLRFPPVASYCQGCSRELLAGRSRLVPELTDEMLREMSPSEEYYRMIHRVGARSVMSVPSIVRGKTIAITTFVATSSSRRYGAEDLVVAEELGRRAAQVIENARLHQRLEESDHRFRVALANSRIVVFEQDADLRYRSYYNPAYGGVDAVGKTHDDLYSKEDAERLTAIKRRVLETGEPAREEVHVSFAGEGHEAQLAVDPVRDARGTIVGVIGSATDISAAKRARQELTQALEIREQVMGVLGHDLRNPLGAIAVSAALVMRNDELPEPARRAAARIDHAARRMAELIGTLLDVTESRFRGTLQLSVAATDLHEVCRRVIDELLAARPDRAIELNLNAPGHGQWDGARLAQVVSNLVGNALTHGSDSHAVRVSIDAEGSSVILRVKNHGAVIPPQAIPGLFEPFRRGPGERSSRGLGLGLYIVRQIVLAHQGTVAVESTAASGTTFTVRLPR